ncbi:MAG: DinB family protein [Anaerolineales bacterium]|jgi:hypothetical protein
MKQLLEYRSKLIYRLEAATDEFRSACLASQDPHRITDEDSWNIHQLAVHTRDTEKLVYGPRIRRTVEEDNPVFENFDADERMTATYDPDKPLASILDELSASVTKTVSLLRELPPEAWSRTSSHEIYGGGFTLQTWVERGLAHIQEHLDTVNKVN